MTNNTLLLQALDFAAESHRDQVRKYTNEPYIFHPIEVAQIVSSVISDVEVAAAALLHDVVEDTSATNDQIRAKFGDRVADLVAMVTKVAKKEDGPRAVRKEMDRVHYANGNSSAQSIKLADVISNTADIVQHDKDFAVIYVQEQEALVNSLTKGHVKLRNLAAETISAAKKMLVTK